MNVLALVKGREGFVLIYDDASAAEALETVKRLAQDPQLTFDTSDAKLWAARILNRWVDARAGGSES